MRSLHVATTRGTCASHSRLANLAVLGYTDNELVLR
jgi:hypothetical protein